MNINTSRYAVKLPDGTSVDIQDIMEEEQTEAFLHRITGMNVISHMVEEARRMKQQEQQDVDVARGLSIQNLFFFVLGLNAHNRELFRKAIPQSEIKSWLHYVIEDLQEATTSKSWIEEGDLGIRTGTLLQSCESMFKHAVPVALAFESDFFKVLTAALKARKETRDEDGVPMMPSEHVCNQIAVIVCQAFLTARMKYDNTWHTEKVFKKLEECGILEEFLRCLTVAKPTRPECVKLIPCVLDQLQGCPAFLGKKFCRGEPCGDTLWAIVRGKDGATGKQQQQNSQRAILNRYEDLIKVAQAAAYTAEEKSGRYRICSYCRKSEDDDDDSDETTFQKKISLMKCARCKRCAYCSKTCQRADWPSHKEYCRPYNQDIRGRIHTKAEQRENDQLYLLIKTFCENHYVEIMVRLMRLCNATGLRVGEMLVVLDYTANAQGVVPALKKMPTFEAAPIRDYIEGSRPAEPDWFDKKKDPKYYRSAIKMFCNGVQAHRERRGPDEVLVLARGNQAASTFGMKIGKQFSDEALDGFRSAIQDHDVEPLRRVLSPRCFEYTQFMLEFNHKVKSLSQEEFGVRFEKYEDFIPNLKHVYLPPGEFDSNKSVHELMELAAKYGINNL